MSTEVICDHCKQTLPASGARYYRYPFYLGYSYPKVIFNHVTTEWGHGFLRRSTLFMCLECFNLDKDVKGKVTKKFKTALSNARDRLMDASAQAAIRVMQPGYYNKVTPHAWMQHEAPLTELLQDKPYFRVKDVMIDDYEDRRSNQDVTLIFSKEKKSFAVGPLIIIYVDGILDAIASPAKEVNIEIGTVEGDHTIAVSRGLCTQNTTISAESEKSYRWEITIKRASWGKDTLSLREK